MEYADNDGPILYVLMRSDVPDYVPGKAMAQSNHAGTQFMVEAAEMVRRIGDEHITGQMLHDWLTEGNGFGTCAVLSVTYPQLLSRTVVAESMGWLSGIVKDTTYPIRDGHRMQALEVDTCGWVFGLKSELAPLLGDLRLF